MVFMAPPLSPRQRERYARHLLLPGFGELGQQRLVAAKVLVVGAGGLGAPVLTYLTAAGVGQITVIDDDVVDSSNLQRQVIHTVDRIGNPKVESAAVTIRALNPDIDLVTIQDRLTAENVAQIVADHDIVIDGTDNFATRYLLNDVCVAMGLPYVWAAIFQYDATLSVFDARRGPCYRCLHPNPPPAGSVPSCADGGVLGVLPGHIGTAQATEAIKVLTGIGQPLIGRIATYSALSGEWDYIPLSKSPTCPACSHDRTVDQALEELASTLVACGVTPSMVEPAPQYLLQPRDLEEFLANEPTAQLIDVRGPQEVSIVAIPGATNIELSDILTESTNHIEANRPVVVYCKSGVRSAQAAQRLRKLGHREVYELSGGVMAWISQVSPEEATY